MGPNEQSDAGAWLEDPTGRFEKRYAVSGAWTEHVWNGSVSGSDPLPPKFTSPEPRVGKPRHLPLYAAVTLLAATCLVVWMLVFQNVRDGENSGHASPGAASGLEPLDATTTSPPRVVVPREIGKATGAEVLVPATASAFCDLLSGAKSLAAGGASLKPDALPVEFEEASDQPFAVAQRQGGCGYAPQSCCGTVMLLGMQFEGEMVDEATYRATVLQLCENPRPGYTAGTAEALVIHGFPATHCVASDGNATTVLLPNGLLELRAGGASFKPPDSSTVDAMVEIVGALQD